MRSWILAPVALCFALPALAQDTTLSTAPVQFNAEQILFRGTDFTFRVPQTGAFGVELTADVASDARGVLEGESVLEWPEAMTQSWSGMPGGGELTVDVDLGLAIDAVLDGDLDIIPFTDIDDFSTHPLRFNLWDGDWAWSVTPAPFDTFLLPGAAVPSTTIVLNEDNAAPAYSWSTDYYDIGVGNVFGCDYSIVMGASVSIVPESRFTLAGTQILTRGRAITAADGTAVIPVPQQNAGTAEYESLWQGTIDSIFAMKVLFLPEAQVWCDDGQDLGEFDIAGRARLGEQSVATSALGALLNAIPNTDFQWDIAEDTRPFQSKNTAYTHDLPAADVSDDSLNFGSVLVGDVAQLNVVMADLGDIDLRGVATVDGAGFTLNHPDVDVTGGGDSTYVVTFTPDVVGDFSGEVVFTTNDPVNPEVSVILAGIGMEQSGGDTGGGDTGSVVEPGRRGCGCDAGSSGTGGAGLSLAMLALGVGVTRRRRSKR